MDSLKSTVIENDGSLLLQGIEAKIIRSADQNHGQLCDRVRIINYLLTA